MGKEGKISLGTLSSVKSLDMFMSPVNRAVCLLILQVKVVEGGGQCEGADGYKNSPCPRTPAML